MIRTPPTIQSLQTAFRREARELMMENNPHLGREFWYTHHIHHKDCNPMNNNMENLEIVERSEHQKIHINMPYIIDRTNCPYCSRELQAGKCLCGRRQPRKCAT